MRKKPLLFISSIETNVTSSLIVKACYFCHNPSLTWKYHTRIPQLLVISKPSTLAWKYYGHTCLLLAMLCLLQKSHSLPLQELESVTNWTNLRVSSIISSNIDTALVFFFDILASRCRLAAFLHYNTNHISRLNNSPLATTY